MQVTCFGVEAETLFALLKSAEPTTRTSISAISQAVSVGESIDELGLSGSTDSCSFASMSPERVATLDEAFRGVDSETLAKLHAKGGIVTPPAGEFVGYVDQWRAAVSFARERGLGLIEDCG